MSRRREIGCCNIKLAWYFIYDQYLSNQPRIDKARPLTSLERNRVHILQVSQQLSQIWTRYYM